MPWQLLAAVGSVESRHGRDPGPTARTRAECSARCSSRPARTRPRVVSNAAGDQGFGGTWGIWRRSSGHPPYRMDDPDDEIAAAAAKIASMPAAAHLWPRAIWRYNALHTYRKTVLRRAARLGMSSACGLLRKSEQAPLAPSPVRAGPSGHGRAGGPGDAAEPARQRRDRLRARRRRRRRPRCRRPAARRAAGLDRRSATASS